MLALALAACGAPLARGSTSMSAAPDPDLNQHERHPGNPGKEFCPLCACLECDMHRSRDPATSGEHEKFLTATEKYERVYAGTCPLCCCWDGIPEASNVCQRDKGCSVCDECCEDYIPPGEECNLCVRENCGKPPSKQRKASVRNKPGGGRGGSDGNVCSPTGCNVCNACCESYLLPGDMCDLCVHEECAPSQEPALVHSGNKCNPAKSCNVCNACCHAYIFSSHDCDHCVKDECHAAPPPLPPAAPPPPPECNPARGCNACTACCHEYLADVRACEHCVEDECTFGAARPSAPAPRSNSSNTSTAASTATELGIVQTAIAGVPALGVGYVPVNASQ